MVSLTWHAWSRYRTLAMASGLLQTAFSHVARRALVARGLFGVRFAPLGGPDYFFDITTIALVRFLTRTLDRSSKLLDMGTGSSATIGLAVWKRVGCDVIACDINPSIVESARRNVAYNHAAIRVVESRFFDSVSDGFDVVSFNAPYVPTGVGLARDLEERRSQWDGGEDGTAVIAAYLDAVVNLSRPITSHLGMNRQHVDAAKMERVLAKRPHLTLSSVQRHPVLPVDIYSIRSIGR